MSSSFWACLVSFVGSVSSSEDIESWERERRGVSRGDSMGLAATDDEASEVSVKFLLKASLASGRAGNAVEDIADVWSAAVVGRMEEGDDG